MSAQGELAGWLLRTPDTRSLTGVSGAPSPGHKRASPLSRGVRDAPVRP
ncbi:hypothetical protein GCM10010211_58900 [Streptomyces albospinus]|uniref:Uncharacterized protein n=1 Tax=Streptomyces albospinus TaxID=285515 RepID=A0ABQ2VFZ3_9ACTN|nr:hypothetical protein GCM10010211_58900 [Streptomyces albospinus]